MSPLNVSQATPLSSAEELDRWLRDNGASEPERIVIVSLLSMRLYNRERHAS